MVYRSVRAQPVVEGDGNPPSVAALAPGAVKVVGTVGFAGSRSGIVVFHASLDTARAIAAAMLHLAIDEVDEDVADAVGEITNMIAGSFRTKLASDGDAWAISVPTVTVGSDFRMRPTACGHRVLIPLQIDASPVVVELILAASADSRR
jgi:chemotaxis protein CheX